MGNSLVTTLTNKGKTVSISRELPSVMIGERINPTGRKRVLAALQAENFETVKQDAIAQVAAGALVLDVNAGVPGANEVDLLPKVVQQVLSVVNVPLCIDTSNPQALETMLKLYDGKPLINSVNGEEKSLGQVLPLAKEFGAAVIGLCMDDDGIPATPEARLSVADKIIQHAVGMGVAIEDIIIDPLAMSLGADSGAGWVTLEATRLIKEEFGVNMTLGASNVSFGLPDRNTLNAGFLILAIQAGITCPITNPLAPGIQTAILSADLALGKDEYAARWIKNFRTQAKKG
jgi:5-methyltetrahydrofolate--homocysteine methyltransferase